MCGRVNVSDFPAIQKMMAGLGMPLYPELAPRFNISPGSLLPVLVNDAFESMQWGIHFGNFSHPNSRIDTVKSKPHLQKLFNNQRCIIPVNGFYEWPNLKLHPEYKANKTRFHIKTPDDVMFLGGIYSSKTTETGQQHREFNVLTTTPVPDIQKFHHRMPVLLEPHNVAAWLSSNDMATMYALTEPYQEKLSIIEVDGYVDNARNEGDRCLSAKKENPQLKLF